MKRSDFARLLALTPLAPLVTKIPLPKIAEEAEGSMGMWDGISRWRYFGNNALTLKWFDGVPDMDDLDAARYMGADIEYTRPEWGGESIVHFMRALQ